jgi:hypothetical protein
LGALRLLSLRQAHKAADWIDPSHRILPFVGVLILSVFAFIFAGREAQAQQLPRPQQQPTAATTGGVAQPVAEPAFVETSPIKNPPEETPSVKTSHVETALIETLSVQTSPVEAPPVDVAAPPAPGHVLKSPVKSVPEPAPKPELVVQPEPVPGQSGQYYSKASSGPDPAAPTSGPTQELPVRSDRDTALSANRAPAPESGPELASPALEPVPEPTLEPVAFEENEPLSWYANEAPPPGPTVPDSGEEELYLPPSLEDSMSNVVETVGSAASSTFETLTSGALLQSEAAEEDEGLIDTALAKLFSVVEVDRVPVSEPAEEPGSSSSAPESPLRDTPQPVSPFVPPAGSSFSLSGGIAVAPSGLALLLLCILVSCPILLRRDGKLLLTICELPKLNSALRLPLERPG